MTTVFGKETDSFYLAFYEADAVRRRKALDAWVKATTSVVQAAVGEELQAFVEFVTEDRWTEEGWERGQEKLHKIQNDYPLVLDVTLRKPDLQKRFRGELPAPVVYKPKTKSVQPAQQETSSQDMANSSSEDDEGGGYEGDGGRSSNDDRSDSINPNNDSHQASMDNHSNQMNPNNEAYWSSRGR